MVENFNDSVIWITGASKGIGKSLTHQFLKYHCKLILSASNEVSFDEFKNEYFEKYKDKIILLPFDLSDQNQIIGASKKLQDLKLNPDILINNAGVAKFKPLKEITIDEYDRMMNINLKAPYLLIQSVLPKMLETKKGLIVNIASIASTKPFANSTVYSASKAGLLMMSKCLREEVRSSGVKIINILPGATVTDIWSDSVRNRYSDKMMNPDLIGKIIHDVILNSLSSNGLIEEIIIRPETGDL